MKTTFCAVLSCLFLAMSFPLHAGGSIEGHDTHSPGGSESGKLKLNAGKKWMTDAALRQAMGEINQAMAKAEPLIRANQFADRQYLAMAGTIRQKVAYIVENCTLEPKADAMLHFVIADLLAGAQAMEGTEMDSRQEGAVLILRALRGYGSHFHHPGWKTAGGHV